MSEKVAAITARPAVTGTPQPPAVLRGPRQSQRSRSELPASFVIHMPRMLWTILDAGTVCLGNYIGYKLFRIQFPTSSWIADMTLANVVVAISFVLAGVICGLYETETLRHRARIAIRSALTVALALAIAFVVMHAVLYENFSRRIVIVAPLAFIAISGSLRLLCHRLIVNLRNRILFVGYDDSVKQVYGTMQESEAGLNYTLLGYVTHNGVRPANSLRDLPYLGCIQDIQAICEANVVHEVVIGSHETASPEISHMIMSCMRLGCRVTNQPTFYERVFGEVPIDHITPDWFVLADIDGHRAEKMTMKRFMDFVLSASGLLLTLPLWPVIALLIKLNDQGPVFYSQKRVGCHNRLFNLVKFRTMKVDAEADGHAWAIPGDRRITPVGRVLRRLHLDELPQLWNIFRGDMSIVGPRPERPEFVAQLIDQIRYYDERHLVKPGLTGWAQVNYRYGCSVEDAHRKLRLDLYYIKHMTLELDLVIIFKTIGILFVKPG